MAKIVKPTKAPKWEQMEANEFKTVWQLYLYTYYLIQQFKRNENTDVHQKIMNV